MKILLAPLNWGLGHASRCVPLVQRLLDEGHEVVLGGDGDSLTLLRKHFPKLRYVYLAPLRLRYSAGQRQVCAMLRALPQLIRWSLQDHTMLRAVLREEHFDQVISDNRFGLFINEARTGITTNDKRPITVYMTHQLRVLLPCGWRWLEPLVARLHARIYTRYNKVWVPDRKGSGTEYPPRDTLAGELSHLHSTLNSQPSTLIEYIGPLSRFSLTLPTTNDKIPTTNYDVVAVLSGLEPHRTMLERELVSRYLGKEEKVLIVQGLMSNPLLRVTHKNITLVPYMNDAELAAALLTAKHIIARSGYSTIMDLVALGILTTKDKLLTTNNRTIELIPTPGQPEQEYLAKWWNGESC